MTPKKVVVVGAGVVGLSTAVAIQRHLPSTEVTIIADKFLEDTLSIGAGGYFRPEGTTSPGDDVSTMVKWCRDGFDHFSGLLEDPLAGMTLTEGYFLSSVSYENCYSAILDEITHGLVRVPHDELKEKFPEKFQYGYRFSTMMTNMRKYMPYLTEKFTEAGGHVVKTTIDTFSDPLLDDYDVIVNCTGLRAKQLTGDFRMVPIRGQTLKVKAPWVERVHICGRSLHIATG
ncbi:D-aspartate oxidase [Halotydeus destructor]|nr:D-aspartate oxidase [Halotydeus destructor]